MYKNIFYATLIYAFVIQFILSEDLPALENDYVIKFKENDKISKLENYVYFDELPVLIRNIREINLTHHITEASNENVNLTNDDKHLDIGNSNDFVQFNSSKQYTSSDNKFFKVTSINEKKADEEVVKTQDDDIAVSFSNYTEDETHHHKYYICSIIRDPVEVQKLWIEFQNVSTSLVHEMLSESYRRASIISLSFNFPFYGHLIKNITIATGGFLYTGTHVHQWLAATQYIAPLMGNFDTGLSNLSTIQYYDNGTAFTVLWENVALRDNNLTNNFTFQVTLLENGDIIFVYKRIPVPIMQLNDEYHPVKVGISDAYIMEKTAFYVRRKTIYEYHRVDKKNAHISNWTALYFKALPTCVSLTNCTSCLSANLDFKCIWCPTLNRCSDGTDRHYQDWIQNKCETQGISISSMCDQNLTSEISITESIHTDKTTSTPLTLTNEIYVTNHSDLYHTNFESARHEKSKGESVTRVSATSIICILLILGLILGSSIWIVYAYRYPHTPSGQFLIRWRPSQWHWRREAGYSAATSFHI